MKEGKSVHMHHTLDALFTFLVFLFFWIVLCFVFFPHLSFFYTRSNPSSERAFMEAGQPDRTLQHE